MAYGQVIKMHNYVYKTPNQGILMDLETGVQYPFQRESVTGKATKWNVKLHDIVSYTLTGGVVSAVTLYKRHVKGIVHSYKSS